MVQDPLITIGNYIRARREELGLSVQELSRTSKVSAKYIEVIETGNRSLLPEKTYLTGFLSLIFKALKLDKEDLIEKYKSQEGEYILQAIVDDKSQGFKPSIKKTFNAAKYFKIYQLYIFAFVVVLLLGIGLFKKVNDNKKYFKPKIKAESESISEEAVIVGEVELQEEKLTDSDEETIAQVKEEPPNINLKNIKLKARAYSWLKVIGVGQDTTLFEGDMMPNSNTSEISLSDEVGFLIVSGNAGGLLLDVGYGFSPLGKEGQRVRWFYPQEARKIFEETQKQKEKNR